MMRIVQLSNALQDTGPDHLPFDHSADIGDTLLTYRLLQLTLSRSRSRSKDEKIICEIYPAKGHRVESVK